jgi:hypothetical protein
MLNSMMDEMENMGLPTTDDSTEGSAEETEDDTSMEMEDEDLCGACNQMPTQELKDQCLSSMGC